MMYKFRPGIVLLQVCNVDLLVAKRELWESFPRIRPISKKCVLICKIMEKGINSDQAIIGFSRILNITIEESHKKFDPIIKRLAEEGYLIPFEES